MDRLTKETLIALCTVLQDHIETTHGRLTKLEDAITKSPTASDTVQRARSKLREESEESIRSLLGFVESTVRLLDAETD